MDWGYPNIGKSEGGVYTKPRQPGWQDRQIALHHEVGKKKKKKLDNQ